MKYYKQTNHPIQQFKEKKTEQTIPKPQPMTNDLAIQLLTRQTLGTKSQYYDAVAYAVKAITLLPVLERDGTLVLKSEHYPDVKQILLKYGDRGTVYYPD